jgi:hypothetical protein
VIHNVGAVVKDAPVVKKLKGLEKSSGKLFDAVQSDYKSKFVNIRNYVSGAE